MKVRKNKAEMITDEKKSYPTKKWRISRRRDE